MQRAQTAAGIAACIEADGFTAGCSKCVGTYGACVIDKCGSECEANPTGAACKTCYTDKCLPAFYSCSGFPKPSSLEMALATDQCTSAQDMKLGADLSKDIPTCLQSSNSEAAFVQCIEADGFTAGCAECVGSFAGCITTECATQCESAPNSSACNQCVVTKCQPAFITCSGYPKPSLKMALATDQCTSAQDLEKAEGLAQDIPKCMRQSQTAAGISACIEADGFTAGCSQCVGTYGACVIDKCGSECEANPTGAACKTCYTDKCMPAFYSCTGFP